MFSLLTIHIYHEAQKDQQIALKASEKEEGIMAKNWKKREQ